MLACPNCGFPSGAATPSTGPRRDVARVGSVAEAGYLVSVLEEAGVEAVSRPDENFNAATGDWAASYRLSVPEAQVAQAVRALQQEAAAQADDQSADTDGAAAPFANPWAMLGVLAVVVAAGAVWSAEHRQPPPRRGDAPAGQAAPTPLAALGRAIGPRGAEFVAEARPGEPARRLRYDADQRVWTLSIDADHDGRFETRHRFD